jgi:two-component system chemotaxis sensor kinase CheA
METVDGLSLAREIRGSPEWAGVPLVALTGRASAADRQAALAAGFDEFLVKLDRDALLGALQRVIERAKVAA